MDSEVQILSKNKKQPTFKKTRKGVPASSPRRLTLNPCFTATKGGPIPSGHPRLFLHTAGSLEKPPPALKELTFQTWCKGILLNTRSLWRLKIRAPTNTTPLLLPAFSFSQPLLSIMGSSGASGWWEQIQRRRQLACGGTLWAHPGERSA